MHCGQVCTSGRPFMLLDVEVRNTEGEPVAADSTQCGEIWCGFNDTSLSRGRMRPTVPQVDSP